MIRRFFSAKNAFMEYFEWLMFSFVKYSNGGCSGFEPDSLFIYSVHNFSKPYLLISIKFVCEKNTQIVSIIMDFITNVKNQSVRIFLSGGQAFQA